MRARYGLILIGALAALAAALPAQAQERRSGTTLAPAARRYTQEPSPNDFLFELQDANQLAQQLRARAKALADQAKALGENDAKRRQELEDLAKSLEAQAKTLADAQEKRR